MTMHFILTDGMPFAVAIVLVAFIGVAEVVGLSFNLVEIHFGGIDHGLDHDVDSDGSFLAWLGIGEVPLSVVLVSFLSLFGGLGLFQQHLLGLPWLLSIPLTLAATLPATGITARLLGKIWPKDETTAVSIDSLVGKRAIITQGVATTGHSAEAKVRDFYNQTHYISIEPHGDATFRVGDEVLIVSREGSLFKGIDPLRAADFRTTVE
jgi:hypothetical protein